MTSQDLPIDTAHPTGMYVRIYVGPGGTTTDDLDTWVTKLNDISEGLAIKISGSVDCWYATSREILEHPDIPCMLNGSGIEQANARNRFFQDAYRFINTMNVIMAKEYFTIPVQVESILLIRPDGAHHAFIFMPPVIDRTIRNEEIIISKKDFKGLQPKEKVALLIARFHAIYRAGKVGERYRAIYQMIEVAEGIAGRKSLEQALGEKGKINYNNLRTRANDYRHGISESADRKSQCKPYNETALLENIIRKSLELFHNIINSCEENQ